MTIQILCTGGATSEQLPENAEATARESGIDCQFEKATDILEIIGYHVMATPALAVDGKVKVAGKVATSAEIRELLR